MSCSDTILIKGKSIIALKNKVICEFQYLLSKLAKGHRLDYEFILEEISLIGLLEEGLITRAQFLEQFYINNKWQTLF